MEGGDASMELFSSCLGSSRTQHHPMLGWAFQRCSLGHPCSPHVAPVNSFFNKARLEWNQFFGLALVPYWKFRGWPLPHQEKSCKELLLTANINCSLIPLTHSSTLKTKLPSDFCLQHSITYLTGRIHTINLYSLF